MTIVKAMVGAFAQTREKEIMFKSWPILYKFSSSGRPQQWSIGAGEYVGNTAYYTTKWSFVNGAEQATTVDIGEGKNIGKANETTPFEQACNEAESKWKGQKDKGYSEGKPKKLKATAPMLAKSYDKEKHKVKFPCHWQPKLDGMRCIAEKIAGQVRLWSRKGKEITTIPHIVSRLEALMEDGEIADGELYYKNTTFQTLLSWIKRAQKNSVKVQYHIYDMISDKPFKDRFERFCKMVGHDGKNIIKTVHTGTVTSHDDVGKMHAENTARGYEGIMLRVGNCEYKVGRRSSDLLKVKKFQDSEFEIVDAYENIGQHVGQCTLVCKTQDGATFGVKPMGTDAQRRKYWDDFKAGKLKGKMLTVKFFEWTTTKPPVPRFPVGISLRDYEDYIETEENEMVVR